MCDDQPRTDYNRRQGNLPDRAPPLSKAYVSTNAVEMPPSRILPLLAHHRIKFRMICDVCSSNFRLEFLRLVLK